MRHHSRAFTLNETIAAAACASILGAVVGPVFVHAQKPTSAANLARITTAAIHYGDDYDERIPLSLNGPYRDLANVHDGQLTVYGEGRADMWPLLLLPYVKDRKVFVDPTRKDANGIFSGPPLVRGDHGYVDTANTYRNQSRFAFYGMNYEFLSPLVIPASKMSDATPTDFMAGEVRDFFVAANPHATVFFVPSTRYHLDPGDSRGFCAVNAPGMFAVLGIEFVPYVPFSNGTPCSGDWCGTDIDRQTPGIQTSEAAFYVDRPRRGNNVSFLDGHVKFMTTMELAAGTNYPTAKPMGPSNLGGAVITDKSKYLWNLDDNYYGA